MKTTVHIISHSHWDREWYLPFEKHRVKLIELMDNAMELFEKDERYRNFHLDGQTIVLDDYLEIRPENREKLKKYVQEGRFHVGPWYILQDEFLTSGEAASSPACGRRKSSAASARWAISRMPSETQVRCPSFSSRPA